jgi:ectoine hydroxylase-related dioxygenase (phytanoyl-CoA dioxygenase family)
VTVQHLPNTAAPEDVAKALADDGVVIVDDLAPGELLDRIEAEMRPFVDATPKGPDEFSGRNTTRTGALVARSPSARELVMHPLALATTKLVLHHSRKFQLHLTQIIAIGPDSPAQYIHRDQWAFDHFPFPNGYEVQCNTIWAMDDFTEENGATRVIPGSNHEEDGLHFPDIEGSTEPAVMGRGSVVFYTGSLYHGGGANRSSAVRHGVNITYNLSWLRQEENQYLSCPIEVARELPEDLLRLMGYARGAYALGYIDDARDPIEVVRPGSTGHGFGLD